MKLKNISIKSIVIFGFLLIFAGNIGFSKTKLTVWCSSDESKTLCDEYNKQNNTNELNVSQFKNTQEMISKFEEENSNANGIVPDIILSENCIQFSQAASKGYLYDLSKDFSAETSELYDSAIKGGLINNKLYYIYLNICSCIFMYRRSLAKNYLGTDDPVEIQKLVSSPSAMLSTAEKINQRSNGKCLFITSIRDLYDSFMAQSPTVTIDDKTKNTDPIVYEWVSFADTFKKNGYTTNLEQWSPKWLNATKGMIISNGEEKEIFSYIFPCWFINMFDKSLKGDFAAVKGLATAFNGGGVIGISDKSKNLKEAVACCKELVLGKTNLTAALQSKFFPASKKNAEQFSNDEWNNFMGGEDYISLLRQVASQTNIYPITAQTEELKSYLLKENGAVDLTTFQQSQSDPFESKLYKSSSWNTSTDGDYNKGGSTIKTSFDEQKHLITINVVRGNSTGDSWGVLGTGDSMNNVVHDKFISSNAFRFTIKGDGTPWECHVKMKQITQGWGYHYVRFNTRNNKEIQVVVPYTSLRQDHIPQKIPFNKSDVIGLEFGPELWRRSEGTDFHAEISNIEFINLNPELDEEVEFPVPLKEIEKFDKYAGADSTITVKYSKSALVINGRYGLGKDKFLGAKINDIRITRWLAGCDAIRIKCIGDGNVWKIKLRQRGMEGEYYQLFMTKKGEMTDVILPITDFGMEETTKRLNVKMVTEFDICQDTFMKSGTKCSLSIFSITAGTMKQ